MVSKGSTICSLIPIEALPDGSFFNEAASSNIHES